MQMKIDKTLTIESYVKEITDNTLTIAIVKDRSEKLKKGKITIVQVQEE